MSDLIDPLAGAALVLAALVVPLALSLALRQPGTIWMLVCVAWALRVIVVAVPLLVGDDSLVHFLFYGNDAADYHDNAIRALSAPEGVDVLQGKPPYTRIVAAVYALLTPQMLLAQFLNLGLSVLVVPMLYHLGRRTGGPGTGLAAAALWTVLPSGLYLSVRLGKDIWVIWGLLLSSLLLLGVSVGRPRRHEYVLGLLGIALLGFIRPPYVLAVLVAMGLLHLVGRTSAVSTLRGGLLLGLGLFALLGTRLGEPIVERLVVAVSEQGAEYDGARALEGGSGVEFLVDVPPGIRWLAQLPFVVGAPFPWQWPAAESTIMRFAGAETLFWYLVYFWCWKERKRAFASRKGKAMLGLVVALFLASSFSLPNIGSMYRYRWPALTILLTVVPGFVHRRGRAPDSQRMGTPEEPRPGGAPGPRSPRLPFPPRRHASRP